MKILLFIVTCLSFISCGGSSSGNGGSGQNENCGKSMDKCSPELYSLKKASQLRSISNQDALELLEKVEDTLSDIKVGSTFLKIYRCSADYDNTKFDEVVINKYIILSYDKSSRELRAKVEVGNLSNIGSCLTESQFEQEEYISISFIPTLAEASSAFKNFDYMRQGFIDNNPALVGFVNKGSRLIEIGFNLNRPYFVSKYLESSYEDSLGYIKAQTFSVDGGVVDISDIDTTGLPEISESL